MSTASEVTVLPVEDRQPERQIAPVTPADLLRIAVERGADLDKLERLMDLQDRYNAAAAERAYNAAFAAFKAESVTIFQGAKVSNGPLSGRRYAELRDVVAAVTPALSRHGLSASWKITRDEKDWLEVTCTLKHVDGHAESVSMGGPPDSGGAKNQLQARASTKTYLERYTLKAICGVAEGGDDTDGSTPQEVPEALLEAARTAAMQGMDAFKAYIKSISRADRAALEPEAASLKQAAREADKAGSAQ